MCSYSKAHDAVHNPMCSLWEVGQIKNQRIPSRMQQCNRQTELDMETQRSPQTGLVGILSWSAPGWSFGTWRHGGPPRVDVDVGLNGWKRLGRLGGRGFGSCSSCLGSSPARISTLIRGKVDRTETKTANSCQRSTRPVGDSTQRIPTPMPGEQAVGPFAKIGVERSSIQRERNSRQET